MDFIDRLREKPAKTKKVIAFSTSAVVTLAIFCVWVSASYFNVGQKTSDATAAVEKSSDSDVNPLSAFWNVLSSGWQGLSENINQIKTATNDAKEIVNTMSSAAALATTTSPISQPVSDDPSQKDVFILDNITQ